MKDLVISSDKIGRGDDEIGSIIIEKFLLNLCEAENLPERMFFLNKGALLCEKNSKFENELKILNERGVKLLVCSTCIDYFKIEILSFTKKSNMSDLIDIMDKGCIII